jgi:hypothetical protein
MKGWNCLEETPANLMAPLRSIMIACHERNEFNWRTRMLSVYRQTYVLMWRGGYVKTLARSLPWHSLAIGYGLFFEIEVGPAVIGGVIGPAG